MGVDGIGTAFIAVDDDLVSGDLDRICSRQQSFGVAIGIGGKPRSKRDDCGLTFCNLSDAALRSPTTVTS